MIANNYLTNDEAWQFAEGTWQKAYERLGAHRAEQDGAEGYRFAVWAPGARSVRVTGSFCGWDINAHFMHTADSTGVWHLFVPGAKTGDTYKYVIESRSGQLTYKADPYAFYAQRPPETSSVLYDPDGYPWRDGQWLSRRKRLNHRKRPLNIYEVHLGSWRRREDGSFLSYGELADTLIPYAAEMGYTHLELLPVMEHPFDGSWGYQITGFYAATSRYGEPKAFMEFIDRCHQAGLGVILDWSPGHFCRDEHGLGRFNGEKLYEKGDHPQWGTYKFDLGRGEVRSFLLSNALFWLEKYHADGIRVDGVTSMLYLNFGIDDPGQKVFNKNGTEEDLDAVEFVRMLNKTVGERHPDAMMIAEESTAWPLVTYPPSDGGLGFHYKWDMGWMHDTLHYMQADFPYRPGAHNLLTFSMMYCFSETFILALSHDEVVHGKCSLIGRMPGDYWRQFAGLRSLAMYQMTHPGAKLNFMGSEIAQFIEWRDYEGLEWFLLGYEAHAKHQAFIRALNAFYLQQPALWQQNYSWDGFEWIDADNNEQSILIYTRRGKKPADELIVLLNFVPECDDAFRIGVPRKGVYKEVFNSDAAEYGGSGRLNPGYLVSEPVPWHGCKHSIVLKTPPIGGLALRRAGRKELLEMQKERD
ncbi:MAG: 1,4-alpha-glucan branching protein GlgB [Firmicutes bacterium]|nr:1,4-alpha-glucan branching protein GlgB [Bacillota bacterium]